MRVPCVLSLKFILKIEMYNVVIHMTMQYAYTYNILHTIYNNLACTYVHGDAARLQDDVAILIYKSPF